MNPYPLLFSPLQVGKLTLRNRIVVPAMHLNYTPDGKVNDQLVAFYEERAAGGAGLLIVGGCTINDVSGGPIFVSLKSDDDIPGLKRLTDAMHAHGALAGAQLYMAGAYAHSMLIGQQAVSSSEHTSGFTRETCRALTLGEIEQMQDDWAAAAKRAQESGFDMVEILGSAGYLICQFLSPKINQRTDQYGGDLDNRMRFGLEVIEKIRAAVGPDYCVGIRIAGNDFVADSHGADEAAIFAKACAKAGVDLINVTGGWHETKVPQITHELPAAGFSYLSRNVKRAIDGAVPVTCSNRIHSPHLAEDILARGDADLICMGRPVLADAELPNKAAQGREELIRQCVACNQGCFDAIPQMQPVGCMVNPRAGREAKVGVTKADAPKRVVVIGGGPGGCQAAITAAERGHEVVLIEAADELGGQVAWYWDATDKPDFFSIPLWMAASLDELNVDVRLCTEADAEMVAELNPDAVILATGARPAMPPIEGLDSPNVVHAWDVLKGRAQVTGREVVVIGGGAVGLETALNVARRGALTPEQTYFLTLFKAEDPATIGELITQGSHNVTVLEMLPKIGKGIGRSTKWIVLGQVKRFGLNVRTKVTVDKVAPGKVHISSEEGGAELPADTVIVAAGAQPRDELSEALAAKGLAVTKVGDCAGGLTVLEAIRQGFDAALAV